MLKSSEQKTQLEIFYFNENLSSPKKNVFAVYVIYKIISLF